MSPAQLELCLRHLEAAETLVLYGPDWVLLAQLALVIDLARSAHGLAYRPAHTSVLPEFENCHAA